MFGTTIHCRLEPKGTQISQRWNFHFLRKSLFYMFQAYALTKAFQLVFSNQLIHYENIQEAYQ